MKAYKLIYILLLCLIIGCDKIEILLPPEEEKIDKVGTGNTDARSILFLKNDTTTLYVNPDSYESYLSSENVGDFISNEEFGKPSPADLNLYNLEDFPTLKPGLDMVLESTEGTSLQLVDYPGAFGTFVDQAWHVNSNWWVLDPQFIDYGYDPATVVTLSGRIDTNITLTKDNKYLLSGQVFVEDGITLTIEAGTVIFGSVSVAGGAGVLIFNRGAKINANGTPEEPIVFTTTAPVGTKNRGQWGGVVFLGKAPNNKGEDILVEGIQGTEEGDGLYGGNDPEDSSGSFSYWRVEYAGVAITPSNEINSLTFGSVGSKTVAHHIIIANAGDDAFQWFGGTMNISYVATFSTLDDDMDMDSGYSGTVQFAYFIRNPFAADKGGASSFEIGSSNALGIQPITSALIANVTVVGPLYQLEGLDLLADPKYQGGVLSKEAAEALLINSVLIGCPVGVQNP
ncbi:hypothetical protein [Algivirga pacifica]|uniref:Uncharacterized protein n=1 Tax=Algivirga pacifica TaxID=1162670 RepID=A0ABP9DAX3_9BACT